MNAFPSICILASAVLAAILPAQVSSASVDIGGKGGVGCQSRSGAPTLTNGVLASASYSYTYDRVSHELRLEVTNTSEVVPGEANPLLTRIYFNVPVGAVSRIKLLSQSAPGQVQPDWAMQLRNQKAACFGAFDVKLSSRSGVRGGIANANAIKVAVRKPVVGPVSFVLKLSGPGVDSIDAQAIANSFSFCSPRVNATGAGKFQAGGKMSCESGYIGSGGKCFPSIWATGDVRLGNRINLYLSGTEDCHACVWFSLTPGPQKVGPFNLPVGLPIIYSADFGVFPAGNEIKLPMFLPNDPNLSGLTIYTAIATFPGTNLNKLETSQAFELVIKGNQQ